MKQGMVLGNKKIIIIAAVLFLTAISYFSVLDDALVADDYYFYSPAVTQNAFKFFLQSMFPNDPDTVFLRPLTILTFAMESHFKGAFPVLPHATNLLLHLSTTVMVGLLIMFPLRGEKAGQSIFAPVAGMLIFALHPQATGAVDFISARFDIMCGLFGTIGVYAWLNSISKPNALRWRLTAIFAFGLSVLSKETGIIFAAAVFAWELWRWVTNRRSIKAKSQIAALCQLAILMAVYCVYRLSIIGGIGGYSIPEATGLYFNGPFGYILVMFWPFVKMGPVNSVILFIAIVIGAVTIVAAISRGKNERDNCDKSPWSLAILLAVFPLMLLVPHLKFLNISQVLDHAEGRLSYVSLIGFSIIMGWLLNKARNLRIGRVTVPVFLSLLMVFYVWSQQSEHSRWSTASRTADSILSQTVALIPAPNKNATLIFNRVSFQNPRYYYVFGIGLPEAVSQRYGRTDLEIIRWPEKEILKNPPDNSYIFKFDNKNLKMKLIHEPQKPTLKAKR